MSSDGGVAPQTIDESTIAECDLAIRIFEDDEPSGVVNIDEQTADYHGSNERVSQLLGRMEAEGFTYRAPASEERQPENEWATATTNVERVGKELAQYLVRKLERTGEGGEVRAEPIGWTRESRE
jgi:hypothetical protein